jgi:cytochrome b pre-mRNA-processing protein 3
MRVTLGQGERERVVRNYMKEMGEQWKGAGLGFDYAIAVGQDLPEMGLSSSSSSSSSSATGEAGEGGVRGDAELAAWVWRNLFAARYSDLPTDFTPSVNPTPATTDSTTSTTTTDAPTTSSATDPSSPIHHLKLPIQLSQIVTFIRRELYRLDQLTDEDVQEGRTGEFGRVKEVVGRKGGEETVDGA